MKQAWRAMAIVVVTATATVAAQAQGCGPTRLKVTESVQLDMKPAAAWALVGNFQDAGWNHDAVLVSGGGGNDPGSARRTIRLANGSVLEESLYKYSDENRTMSWHIDRSDQAILPIQNAAETLNVVGADGGAKSKIVWRSAFYRSLKDGEGAPDQADAAASRAMAQFMRASLDHLKVKLAPKS